MHIHKEAVIDGNFRYSLTRKWEGAKPQALFIMLNPSTADAEQDDPTIRRLISFSKSFGFGGFQVGNLIPYRCSCPDNMFAWIRLQSQSELTPTNTPDWVVKNLQYVSDMADQSKSIILAWGNDGPDVGAMTEPDRWGGLLYGHMVKLLRYRDNLYHLGLTKDGRPRHPLYLHSETPLNKINQHAKKHI